MRDKLRRRALVLAEYHQEVRGQVMPRWFAAGGGRNNFAAHVRPHAGQIQSYLEIGTWAGGSLFWVFEQLKPIRAIAIDPYPADRKRTRAKNKSIGDKIEQLWAQHYPGIDGRLIREPSEQALPVLAASGVTFDFAYIDGSHHGADAFFDAALVSRMVKPGGFLIFDDFKVARLGNIQCLRYAIDAFVRTHADDWELLFANVQVGLRRRPERLCHVGEVPGTRASILHPGEWENPRPATLRHDTANGIVGTADDNRETP